MSQRAGKSPATSPTGELHTLSPFSPRAPRHGPAHLVSRTLPALALFAVSVAAVLWVLYLAQPQAHVALPDSKKGAPGGPSSLYAVKSGPRKTEASGASRLQDSANRREQNVVDPTTPSAHSTGSTLSAGRISEHVELPYQGSGGRPSTKAFSIRTPGAAESAAGCPGVPGFESRVAGASSKGVVPWTPRPRKYLILQCGNTHVSDVIGCISMHLLVAGLLNRTLVVPSHLPRPEGLFNRMTHKGRPRVITHYELDLLWDTRHTRRCYGRNSVISAKQFRKRHKGRLAAPDLVLCWGGVGGECGTADETNARLLSGTCPATVAANRTKQRAPVLGPTQLLPLAIDPKARLGKGLRLLTTTAVASACLPRVADLDEFLRIYRNLTEGSVVLGVGNVGGSGFDPSSWVYQHGGLPFVRSPKCANSLSVAAPEKMGEAARRLRKELFKREPFACVDWGGSEGLEVNCSDQTSVGDGRCGLSEGKVAQCAAEKARASNLTRLLLATNASPDKVQELESAVQSHSNLPIRIKRIDSKRMQGLEDLSEDDVAEQGDVILHILQKEVCAQSKTFVSSDGLSFSEAVQSTRYGLMTAACTDSLSCV